MNIRRATITDVPQIMECAREFCNVLGWELNEKHYGGYWEKLVSADIGVIFLLEHDGKIVGGIGGLRSHAPHTGIPTAAEQFWYVKPEHRKSIWSIKLLREFEAWAALHGCRQIDMAHMEHSMPEELKQFYVRAGYKPLETYYRKQLV